MDPKAKHGDSGTGEMRSRYIFNYYSDSIDEMDSRAFKELIRDLIRCRSPSASEAVIENEIAAKRTELLADRDAWKWQDFLKAVGSLKVRGTSSLFRARKDCMVALKTRLEGTRPPSPETAAVRQEAGTVAQYESKAIHTVDAATQCESEDSGMASSRKRPRVESLVGDDAAADSSVMPTEQDYRVHPRVLHVQVDESVREESIFSLGDEAISSSAQIEMSSGLQDGGPFGDGSSALHKNAKEMMKGLRYFKNAAMLPNGLKKRPCTWDGIHVVQMARCIIYLCDDVMRIFAGEPRLLELQPPAYVFGDIHGKIEDLFAFGSFFWRLGPENTPTTSLFLGDYVDRGLHGIEVVCYLFAQKVFAPTRFFLLRGNHELRMIQQNFNFHKQCMDLFKEDGSRVFQKINECFDMMPLAAIVDSKIFCVHGGIPHPKLLAKRSLKEAIESIPRPLKSGEPQHRIDIMCPLAWEIMWNDPVNEDSVGLALDANGFGTNEARHTGRVFSSNALDDFLNTHGLSHVIRAHQVQNYGFKFRFCGKLLTIFSSSEYCQQNNQAACVLIDSATKQLKMITLPRERNDNASSKVKVGTNPTKTRPTSR